MPILLGTPKLGTYNIMGLPVGQWYNQIEEDESSDPDFKDHLRIIQRPLDSSEYHYIACDRFLVADGRRGAESIPTMTARVVSMIEQAVDLQSESPTYRIKMSIGYIFKMFTQDTTASIDGFVDDICAVDGVDSVVESWHVIDEPVAAPRDPENPNEDYVTAANMATVVQAFQEAQVDRGKNWPFIYAENGDGRGGANGWWPVYNPSAGWAYRKYDTSNYTFTDINGAANDAVKIRAYIDAIADATHNGVDAIPLLQPFYYPWASGHFQYSVLPPIRKWHYIQEWWSDAARGRMRWRRSWRAWHSPT